MVGQQRIRSTRLMQQDLAAVGTMPLELPTDKVENILLFDQNVVVASTGLFSSETSDLYEVTAYVVCTVAGAGNLDVMLAWDDGYASHNESIANVNLAAVGNYASSEKIVRVLRDTLATYEVAITGLGGGAEYALFLKVRKL